MSWPDFWTQTNWKTLCLQPLSKLVCRIASRRRLAFQEASGLKVAEDCLPVCVIGNIVVGGSGKTPFILALVKAAQMQGLKLGIVSRGYGGKSKQWPQRVYADSDPNLVGDEPVMLARALQQFHIPIAVAPKRQQAVELLSQQTDCDWIISDDGLQHYQMSRVCEIVLVDGARGFGNGHCLPAGPLREPVEKLKQVDALVVNGEDQQKILTNLETSSDGQALLPKLIGTMQLTPIRLVNVVDETQTLPIDELANHSVNAMAGIGNPERFFETLVQLGAQVSPHPFADHHAYSFSDLKPFAGLRQDKEKVTNLDSINNALIMTEKDAVKCRSIAQQLSVKHWWYLQVESEVDSAILTHIFNKMAQAPR
ncbi:tetraacyldisaccharide 4'-kinase [Thiomicrorhabdus indica]|uniref:tetraacyldisaccharide 4'-kinase n=1 Tax=Thiomicrorhabdus indica TaxID=2267253 RepID=UPI00102DE8B1|nr:tetraacyldisaccharide 4'-kinase [Thiomicrorhabdus indica]